MIGLPPLPDWNGLHPLVVHFPIALLLVAPLFVLVGVWLRAPRNRTWLAAALTLLALGTLGAWVAVSTGEREERSPSALRRSTPHSNTTRSSPSEPRSVHGHRRSGRDPARTDRVATASRGSPRRALGLFLIAYLAGAALLANTAHAGGRLVHQLGVQAMVADTASAPAAPASTEATESEEKD